jgi:hypothetical protein
MRGLVYGAVVIGTPDQYSALEWGVDALPDETCRDICRHALRVYGPRVERLRRGGDLEDRGAE